MKACAPQAIQCKIATGAQWHLSSRWQKQWKLNLYYIQRAMSGFRKQKHSEKHIRLHSGKVIGSTQGPWKFIPKHYNLSVNRYELYSATVSLLCNVQNYSARCTKEVCQALLPQKPWSSRPLCQHLGHHFYQVTASTIFQYTGQRWWT